MSNTIYPKQVTVDDLESRLLRKFNSYRRLPVLLRIADYLHDGGDWLALLGKLWSGFDNIGVYGDDVFNAIHERVSSIESVIPQMMSDEERVAFDALPEHITIYRGCGPRNMSGFCWSLDRGIAAKFPFMTRYRTNEPMLLTATISKRRASALKLERGEQEIIVFDYPDEPSIRWTEEPLFAP